MQALERVALVALAGLLTAACDPTGPGEPLLEAEIIAIQLDGHPLAPRILLGDTPGGGIWFTVTDSTVIERLEADGGTVRIGFEELETGVRARAWHRGPVVDSDPQQTEAARVLVLGPTRG